MASMNYCFTVCRAAEEKAQQEAHSTASPAIDIPSSSSPGTGAYFFGRFFSFNLTPPASTSTFINPLSVKASSFTELHENLF